MKFKFWERERKDSATASQRSSYIISSGAFEWGSSNPETLIKDGYERNTVVYKCVSAIARAASRVSIKLYNRGGKEITEHPLLDLLDRPNPMTSRHEFIEAALSFLLITGESFIERVLVSGQPRELWLLPPQHMEVTPGRSFMPAQYVFSTEGGGKHTFLVDFISKDSDVLQLKFFNPRNYWRGLSPLAAAGLELDTSNYASLWLKSLLKKGAVPPGALVHKPKDGNEVLTDEQFDRLKQEFAERFNNIGDAGKPLLLDGNLEWVPFAASPVDIGYSPIKEAAAISIAQVYDVPPQLIGITAASTFSNMQEAREYFYLNAVFNVVDQLISELNVWLVPKFGDNLYLTRDDESILALENLRQRKRESVLSLFNSNLISLNEARAALGYEAVEGGDQIMVSAGKLPIDFDQMPSDGAVQEALDE